MNDEEEIRHVRLSSTLREDEVPLLDEVAEMVGAKSRAEAVRAMLRFVMGHHREDFIAWLALQEIPVVEDPSEWEKG